MISFSQLQQLSGIAALLWMSAVEAKTPTKLGTHRSSPFSQHRFPLGVIQRGGQQAAAFSENALDDEIDVTKHPDFASLQSYRMQQQQLLQLRSTFLSEALANRGLPLPTLMDVATPEGTAKPQEVDWDCVLATESNPKSCLYSFDAEANTKVVAPLGTEQWISLGALNRLRRTDPTKVEPMWHSQYAILNSWFDPDSEYSLLQHVGIVGLVLNALLQGNRLPIVLGFTMTLAVVVFMPILEYIANRFLVSGLLWSRWHHWARFVHAALPLKLFLGQMLGSLVAKLFDKFARLVKERLVDLECQMMEDMIPLTILSESDTMSEEDEELDFSEDE